MRQILCLGVYLTAGNSLSDLRNTKIYGKMEPSSECTISPVLRFIWRWRVILSVFVYPLVMPRHLIFLLEPIPIPEVLKQNPCARRWAHKMGMLINIRPRDKRAVLPSFYGFALYTAF